MRDRVPKRAPLTDNTIIETLQLGQNGLIVHRRGVRGTLSFRMWTCTC